MITTSLLVCLVLPSLLLMAPQGSEAAKRSRKKFTRESRTLPNIIFILTDDLDNELGSPLVLNKTRKVLMEGGAEFVNSFVTTPMCCPSRSSILTGTYVHNNFIFTNNNNCSGPAWRKGPERRTIGTYLHEAGYVTGYFGKYLNEYDGQHIPPGWKRWFGLIKNSRYYNYNINNNGTIESHKNIYAKDYLTDLIANKSISFFTKSKTSRPHLPVMMLLSLPAPHGPEDGAPQYQDAFPNATVPRTPNWNINSPDKHWIIRNTFPMDQQKISFQDLLHRKRLQTLLSVDDLVYRVFRTVKDLGLLHETYIIFSSDHGYHLGQFGLVKGKSMPYEMDIKVPFYIRGPGIPKNVKMTEIIANIDWTPSVLDMASVPTPAHMDGQSFMKLFNTGIKKKSNRKQTPWRDTVLIERGKPWRFNRSNSTKNRRRNGEDRSQLLGVCSLKVYQSPCKPGQIWECVVIKGRPRFKKCKLEPATPTPPTVREVCTCYKKRKTGFSTYTIIKDIDSRGKIDRQSTDAIDAEVGSGLGADVPEFSERNPWINDHAVIPEAKTSRHRKRSNRKISKFQTLWKSLSVYKRPNSQSEKMLLTGKEPVPEAIGMRLIRLKAKIADTRLRLENLRERRNRLVQAVNVGHPEEYCTCRNETLPTQEKRKKGKIPSRVRISDNHKIHPLLRVKKEETTKKKGKGKGKSKRGGSCNVPGLNCFKQTNDHWKVPPLWTGGEFCFCPNTNNNTYNCLRTINKTHNFLYCEFVTNFTEYFDINTDPYQLHNTVASLPLDILTKLHNKLALIQGCKGRECSKLPDKFPSPTPPTVTNKKPTEKAKTMKPTKTPTSAKQSTQRPSTEALPEDFNTYTPVILDPQMDKTTLRPPYGGL